MKTKSKFFVIQFKDGGKQVIETSGYDAALWGANTRFYPDTITMVYPIEEETDKNILFLFGN